MRQIPVLVILFVLAAACTGDSFSPGSSTPVATPDLQVTRSSNTPLVSGTVATKQGTPDSKYPVIMDVPPSIPKYSRKDWRHWIDQDRDCQNARHEVLIIESSSPVTFKSDRGCKVVEGKWTDSYTGEDIYISAELDIDHMIPLKNAHDSGGWQWSKEKKKDFANDLSDPDHLIAVTSSANRKKGAKGPDQWKPSNKAYWCEYARDWIRIKSNWELAVTPRESDALQLMLSTCESKP